MPVEQTTRSDSVGQVRTVDEAVSECYAGYVATAVKRGRNPAFPFVPVYRYPSIRFGTATTQIPKRAYADREAAVACANSYVERLKQNMRERLVAPGERALRAQWGVELPK